MVHVPNSYSQVEKDAFLDVVAGQVRGSCLALLIFAVVIGSLILLHALYYWISRLRRRLSSTSNPHVVSLTGSLQRFRLADRTLTLPVKPPYCILALIYVALNVFLSFWNIAWNQPTSFGNRLGWLSLANMLLAVLLGLKNTPLSPIAGKSYEQLNVLHRCCGQTTIVLTVLHTM